MVRTTLQFVCGHNEETSSQKVKKELKLTKGRYIDIYERPVEYQKGIWQTLNGYGAFTSALRYLHVCTGCFCSMGFKWWIKNQTFLTGYFHFPKLSPRSDRIVNSLCLLRCKGYHGTITVLRCQRRRGLEGQLSSHEGYQFKMSPTEMKAAFCMTACWHQVYLPQMQWVSCLCALAR